MTKYVWPLAFSFMIVLLGGGLMLWPFARLPVPQGAWGALRLTDFWTGVGIVVVGFGTAWAWWSALVTDMIRQGYRVRRSNPEVGAQPDPIAPADDWEQWLRPLAESVLRDLEQQLAQKEAAQAKGERV